MNGLIESSCIFEQAYAHICLSPSLHNGMLQYVLNDLLPPPQSVLTFWIDPAALAFSIYGKFEQKDGGSRWRISMEALFHERLTKLNG